MGNYIIQRLFQAIVVVILVSIVVFGVMRLLPGDPVLVLAGLVSLPAVAQKVYVDFDKSVGF